MKDVMEKRGVASESHIFPDTIVHPAWRKEQLS
jgi:hypothetical protein